MFHWMAHDSVWTRPQSAQTAPIHIHSHTYTLVLVPWTHTRTTQASRLSGVAITWWIWIWYSLLSSKKMIWDFSKLVSIYFRLNFPLCCFVLCASFSKLNCGNFGIDRVTITVAAGHSWKSFQRGFQEQKVDTIFLKVPKGWQIICVQTYYGWVDHSVSSIWPHLPQV